MLFASNDLIAGCVARFRSGGVDAPAERERLLQYGKVIGRAIEELMTIVSPATFYRWVREGRNGKPKTKNPKGGQRKPRNV